MKEEKSEKNQRKAWRRELRRVRKKLDNPYMGVSAEAIEFYYFVSV